MDDIESRLQTLVGKIQKRIEEKEIEGEVVNKDE
jgi:hypothetical protein